MKNCKNGLDEMQKLKRDKIGNQTFMLMFYLLMLDMGLYSFGIKWLAYPVNVMVIITACMILHLVRLIASNAYVPPEAQKPNLGVKTIIMIIFTIALSLILVFALQHSLSSDLVNTDDNSAVILMLVSGVGLIIVAIVSIIKKISAKNDKDD